MGGETGHTEDGFGRHEQFRPCAEGVVEVVCALAGELEVLPLVFAYRYVGRPGGGVRGPDIQRVREVKGRGELPVDEDVCCLQDGIGE